MAQEMQVETALIILGIRENFTRETLKIKRDHLIGTSKIIINGSEAQLKFDQPEQRKNKLNSRIAEEEKKIENIKEAYRVLKQFHRRTHSSTAHNRFTNARKGVTGLFGRMRQGITGLASRMYTRRNGNGASEGTGRSRRSRTSPEETKGNNGNESPYTKSRRESGRPYGTNWSRSRQPFSGFTGTRQIFRKSEDKEIDKYLKILGLPLKVSSFTKDEIRKAYRICSLRTHPNKNPNGAEEFKAVNDANQKLKEFISNEYEYTPPQGSMPTSPKVSPMYSKATSRAASPKARPASRATSPKARASSPKARAASRASSPKARAASPKASTFQEKESHIMRLKKALGVLGLDPNIRHNSDKILDTFLANTELTDRVDNAFRTLYYNMEAKPQRPKELVEAFIKQRRNRYKNYKENI